MMNSMVKREMIYCLEGIRTISSLVAMDKILLVVVREMILLMVMIFMEMIIQMLCLLVTKSGVRAVMIY